jgi:hypothetical protein
MLINLIVLYSTLAVLCKTQATSLELNKNKCQYIQESASFKCVTSSSDTLSTL